MWTKGRDFSRGWDRTRGGGFRDEERAWCRGVINAEGKSIEHDRRRTNISSTDSGVKDLIWNPFWFANVTPVGIPKPFNE